jgi:YbbR domain-containing protein
MNVFKHNWQVKLVAFILAVVCKFVVGREQNRATQEFRVPVSIEAPTGQRVLSPPAGYRVYVNVEGPVEVVRTIRQEEIRLQYDASLVRPGRTYDVPVQAELPEKYRNVVIVTWTPHTIPVQLASDATRKMPVLVRVKNAPREWEFTEPPRANPATVTVSGTEEVLGQVERVVAPVEGTESTRLNALASVQAEDAQGNRVPGQVTIEPPQVNVSGIQQRVLLEKRVPVQPVFTLPSGTAANVEVVPPRVRIIGAEPKIGEVYVLETERVETPRGPGTVRRQVAVKSPGPDVQVVPSHVQVTIRVTAGPRRVPDAGVRARP